MAEQVEGCADLVGAMHTGSRTADAAGEFFFDTFGSQFAFRGGVGARIETTTRTAYNPNTPRLMGLFVKQR